MRPQDNGRRQLGDAESTAPASGTRGPPGIGGAEHETIATDASDLLEHQRPRRQMDRPNLSGEIVWDALAVEVHQHHPVAQSGGGRYDQARGAVLPCRLLNGRDRMSRYRSIPAASVCLLLVASAASGQRQRPSVPDPTDGYKWRLAAVDAGLAAAGDGSAAAFRA